MRAHVYVTPKLTVLEPQGTTSLSTYMSPERSENVVALTLKRSIDAVSPGRRRELRIPLGISRAFIGMSRVMTVPCHRLKLLISPLRLYRSATPLISKVVQHIDQAALRRGAVPLHDVQIRIGM
jgi:hypothetical protein